MHARHAALKIAFSGFRSEASAYSLEAIETAAARLKAEEARRLRILAA
jgi:hypothetical protein